MGMEVHGDFNAFNALKAAANSRNVRAAILNQMESDMQPYVPYKNGYLTHNVSMNLDATLLIYSMPYAKRQFYGIGITNYTKAVHRLAGKRWDLRGKAQFGQDWALVAQNAIKRELKH